jgi:hypothetical protein
MTVFEALAILEAAILECKKRDINTLEVWEALNLLGLHIQPGWLIPQYRMAFDSDRTTDLCKEGQQQVLRATFPGIRSSVKKLLGKHMDALARKFAATHDAKVREEIEHLSRELIKLDSRWVFVGSEGRSQPFSVTTSVQHAKLKTL